MADGAEVLACETAPRPGARWEQVSLLAPEQPQNYLEWRRRRNVSGRTPRRRPKAEELYPPDLIACLHAETATLEKQGWSQPPGSRRVLYWRPTDAIEAGAPRLAGPARKAAPVEIMLLGLATASGNRSALPSVTRTLPQAELLHRALVHHVSRGARPCVSLIGKSEDGEPLDGHRHVHLLPMDLDGDGRLESVLLWAPMRLDADAQVAVRAVRRTYTKGGAGPLRVALVGLGGMSDLDGVLGAAGSALRETTGPTGGAMEWTSQTPFVPPRHLKTRGNNTISGQVQAELVSRGLPPASVVEIIDPHAAGVRLLRHFVLHRRHGPAPPRGVGLALRLRFAEPIVGPLCLGYASHFGLGRFVARSWDR